jgi:hypothetical protein
MALLAGVDNPPTRQAHHLVADYVELMCAASIDGEYSASDFRSIRKKQDADGTAPIEISERELALEGDAEEFDPLIGAIFDGEEQVDPFAATLGTAPPEGDGPNESPGPALADDDRVVESSELVQHLAFRAEVFGDTYPFELRDDDNLVLRELTDLRRIYLFLLISSCLPKLERKTDERTMTTAFELVCRHALQAHLGSRFQVHGFGTAVGATDRRYDGTLWENVQKLAADLRVAVVAKEEEVKANYGGDNGLDVVAWVPMGDSASGLVVVFAQCASGRRWRAKQGEASEDRWRRVLQFTAPMVNATIIPYCYRRPDGSWYIDYQVSHGVLIDRVRLMHALRHSDEDREAALADLADALIDELLSEDFL